MSQNNPGFESKKLDEKKSGKRSGDLADEAKEAVQKVAQRVKEGATEAVDEVRHQVREQTVSAVHEQQELIADKLDSVCDAVRESAKKLRQENVPAVAGLIETAADQVDALSHYIRDKELTDMVHGAQNWVRQNPAIFLGGCFVLGMVVARVIKSAQTSSGVSYGHGGQTGRFSSFEEGASTYQPESRFASSQYGGSAYSSGSQSGVGSTGAWEEP